MAASPGFVKLVGWLAGRLQARVPSPATGSRPDSPSTAHFREELEALLDLDVRQRAVSDRVARCPSRVEGVGPGQVASLLRRLRVPGEVWWAIHGEPERLTP
jgi:hypothetical protein